MGSVVTQIVVFSLQTMRAAETVRQNKKECDEIVSCASRVTEILIRMNEAQMLDSLVLRDSLDSLAKSLERALELVTSCQQKNALRRLLGAGDTARQLQQVKDDMSRQVMLLTFAASVHATNMISRSPAPLLPSSSASQPQDAEVVGSLDSHHSADDNSQDAEVVGSSDSHHSADDNRSEMDGEENNVPAAGCIISVASVSDFTGFSLSDLEAATNNFSADNIIGSGPYSFVYKGKLQGVQEIAIKSHRRFAEFPETRAVDGLKYVSTKLKHQNILGVLGCALGLPKSERDRLEENKKHCCYGFLVVEEKMHGSLHQIIRGSSPRDCNWNSRFKIIKGIADGLSYIHEKHAVHSNLKPSNILIDTDPNKSKICDFGVARVLDNGDLPNSSYLAPEYLSGKNPLTTKSDVYAFGLILLETIRSMCGALPDNDPKTTITWASEVQHAQRMNLFRLMPGRGIDKLLKSQVPDKSEIKEIKRCMDIGLLCCKDKPEDRPSMEDVVKLLGGRNTEDDPGQVRP